MGSTRHELASSQHGAAVSTADSLPAANATTSGQQERVKPSHHKPLGSALGESTSQQSDSVEQPIALQQEAAQHAQSSSSTYEGRQPVQSGQEDEHREPSCSHEHSSVPKSNHWQVSNGDLLNGTSPRLHHGHHDQTVKAQRQQHQQQHQLSHQQHEQHQHRQPHQHQHPMHQHHHLSLPSSQLHRSPSLPPLQRHRRTLSQQVESKPGKQHRHRRTLSLHEELQLQHGKQLQLALEQQGSPLPQWEKVLWKQQPFPDTYTDATFLKELVVNADVPKRSYWRVVLGSAAVTQQISTVIAAVVVPVHLRQHNFTAQSVLAVCAVLLVVGYSICCFIGGHILGGSLRRGIRQVLLLTGGVYLLSPLLHSLTRTISEDSIIAMTVGLLILHLYLHDYNFVNSVTDKLTGTVSLGAAVLASVLIASGMPSEYDVFVHILFCLELYLLSPFMRRYIRQASLMAHIGLTLGMVGTAMGLLLPLSPNLTTVFLVVVVFISFLCPRWLVRIHKFKAKINGPWDEAVPQIANVLTQQPGWDASNAASNAAVQPVAQHAKVA